MREIALTRDVSPALAACELTFRPRESIDVPRAVAQHAAYCRLLEDLGLEVLRLHPGWLDLAPLGGIEVVRVPADEPEAANVLRVGGSVIAHAAAPSRRARP